MLRIGGRAAVAAGERLLSGLQRGGERFTGARDFAGQRLGHAPAQLDAFLEVCTQVCGEIHRVRFYPTTSNAARIHRGLSPSSVTTSKRHGGSGGTRAREARAAATTRHRFGTSTLSAAPPKESLVRMRTSTNTRDSPSRAVRSISPKRVREI